MKKKICIIGSGPTGIYTLKHLVSSPIPLSVTIYEAEAEAGKGTPYLPGINDPIMLANIPSIEIPRLNETLVDWLYARPDDYLTEFGIVRNGINGRQFYPRLVLGDYLHDQFVATVAEAERCGHVINVLPNKRVTDIAVQSDEILVTGMSGDEPFNALFDHVVLATGHNWPEQTQSRPGYFTSAWPATALQAIEGGRVGILGTSLSAIDALMTVATSAGSFIYDEGGTLQFKIAIDRPDFHATLMSRKGLLPEADFYCPLPYLEPKVCNSAAVERIISEGPTGLLDKVFELFRQEVTLADAHYASALGLSQLNVDSFADAYYGRRADMDPFIWAAGNLAEAEQNMKNEFTVPWRYAIMITHEIIATVVPHLNAEDFARFNKSFKGIFIDEYATVPHLSIKRLLALRNAGRLDILKLGKDYEISSEGLESGARLTMGDKEVLFENFIDATGQSTLSANDLPFPTLIQQGAVQEAPTYDRVGFILNDTISVAKRSGGIDVDESYRAKSVSAGAHRIYCAAIPFLLHKHPFVQGITSAAEIGEVVAHAIINDVIDTRPLELLTA
jgi:uncharacterized NAD(P)/FAD-binding protein YdhS